MSLAVIVLEDEPAVRAALARDLEEFAAGLRIEFAEDAQDARDLLEEVTDEGDVVALLLADHRLPGESGVDFLVSTMADERVASTRRVLVTGQADHADTIRAINSGGLDHYIAKPWEVDDLHAVVRDQLTGFVVDCGINPLPYLPYLDQARALASLRRLGLDE